MGDKGDPITLDFEDGLVTYEGTIIRGAVFGGKYEGLAVGGAGGLSHLSARIASAASRADSATGAIPAPGKVQCPAR